MRLLELALHRYGALTERVLPLGPGLTLVTGGNEAGKSTTLDAIAALLWGIPRGAAADFLHGRQSLSVGARVRVAGAEHAVHRDSRTLTAGPVGSRSAFVPPWEGAGDTAARWRSSFGLDHAELTAGGAALCAGTGDLAELVFTARHGARLGTLLAEVTGEADALWKAHGNARSVEVRRALREHTDAVARVEEATGRAALVAEAREASARAEQEATRTEEHRLAAATAHAEATARAAAREPAMRLREIGAALSALSSPRLAVEQAAVVAAASAAAAQARAAAEGARARLSDAEARLAAVEVDEGLLTDADAVRSLLPESGARAEDAARAAGLRSTAASYQRIAAECLSELGDGVAATKVPAGVALDLDGIAAELEDSAQIVAAAREAVREAEGALDPAEVTDTELDEDAAAAVREAAQAVRGAGSATSLSRAAAAALVEAEHDRAVALSEAGAPDGVPAGWPEAESRARAADTLAAARARCHAAEAEVTRLSDELAEVVIDTAGDDGSAERAAWAEARSERTRLLDDLLTAWTGGGSVAEHAALAGRLGAAVERADAAAEQLLRGEGERARRGEVDRRLARVRTTLAAAEVRVEDAAGQEVVAQQEWAALWPGLTVPAPSQAEAVVAALARARAADLEAQRLQQVLAAHARGADDEQEGLRGALAAAGRSRPRAALEALLTAADDLATAAAAARDRRTRAATLVEVLAGATARLEGALGVQQEVQERWAARSAAAGLAPGTGPTGWEARQQAVRAGDAAAQQAAEATAEAEAAEQRWATHRSAVQGLATRHACPPELAPAEVLVVLGARLRAAELGERERADLSRRRLEALDERSRADEALGECGRALAGVAEEVGLSAGGPLEALTDALAAAAERGEAERALRGEQARLQDTLARLLPGEEPDTAAETLSATEPAVLEQAATAAAALLAEAESARRRADERLGERRRAQQESESAEGAAELQARAQSAAAAVAEAAERYVVAAVQREVLAAELAEHESLHASPLLDAATGLLRRLTGGRWTGLVRSRTAGDRRLLIVNAAGEELPTSALSEGTADQVFLALRLAGIAELQAERVAQGLPTLPVVLDDVLMTFDDRRAAAALEVLADLSRHWQVIVLSHHEHLARLELSHAARENLTVSRLPAPGDPTDLVAPFPDEVVESARLTGSDRADAGLVRDEEMPGVLFAVD